MSKHVIYHWIESRSILVPDDCPTETFADMHTWLVDQSYTDNDGNMWTGWDRENKEDKDIVLMENEEYPYFEPIHIEKSDSKDYEIVMVDTVPTRIDSEDHLHNLLRDNIGSFIDFYIQLNYNARSSKEIDMDEDGSISIMHDIDGTVSEYDDFYLFLKGEPFIREAIQKKAFFKSETS